MKKTTTRRYAEFLADTDRYEFTSVFKQLSAKHGVTLADLISGRRTLPYPQARAEIWRWLRAEGWSYPRIAELFGMHHTTVIYWCHQRDVDGGRS